jgi:two-component system OmpR family sensor kinase
MSIRVRLTLWYTTILAVVIIVFGAALYTLLTFTLLNRIDSQLQGTAEIVAQSARVVLPLFGLETVLEVPELDVMATPGLYIQVYDVDAGQTLRSRTLGEGALPLDDNDLNAALAGRAQWRTMSVGGTKLRNYSAPLTVDGRVEGIIQVGTSLAQLEQTQTQLLRILVTGGLLAVVVSAVLGALLARAALRPIDRITQTALTISRTEDLSRRLDVRGPADEVGRLASTFNEMLARLEALFRTQQRFIADVSHELRTPLTTIQGNVDLLCRGAAADPQARREVLADIEGEAARMSRLVADLLLLARVDAGVHLDQKPVEMDTLLLDIYRQARVMSDGIDVYLGHEDQAVVLGDADRLRQLLLNLVDNALKYTPAGGRVTLSLHNEGQWVRIEVGDTGVGVPAAALAPGTSGRPLIFERFYRADPARSRAKAGSGLGLSIAWWIAQAHGGRIEVESTVGKGTTFSVWLPLSSSQTG